MFTGIIEAAGKIESLEHGADGGRLRVSLAVAPSIAAETKLGDSISVNGCCLTVVEFSTNHFSADLSGETLRRTSLGEKKPGDIVNLERPLAAGGRLGGHFVQGHVDGVGRVTRLEPEGNNWWLSVAIPEDLRGYVVEKGSIAIDGISLTVARWKPNSAAASLHAERSRSAKALAEADFAIIPFTYDETNVHSMAPGDAVNLEVDILAKYVESLLAQRDSSPAHAKPSSPLTISNLREQGF
jgi:riboflavin synthase